MPTIKDIYDIVNRLEDKLDNRFSDLDKRIGLLESFKNNLIGKITVVTLIISFLVASISSYAKDVFSKGVK